MNDFSSKEQDFAKYKKMGIDALYQELYVLNTYSKRWVVQEKIDFVKKRIAEIKINGRKFRKT